MVIDERGALVGRPMIGILREAARLLELHGREIPTLPAVERWGERRARRWARRHGLRGF
jgi:hypothetical protein